MATDHLNLKLLIFVGILQVLRYDFKKFRILEILNFHPCEPCFYVGRYESNSGGEREIQRTMLELLNQLDGFDSRGDVKV